MSVQNAKKRVDMWVLFWLACTIAGLAMFARTTTCGDTSAQHPIPVFQKDAGDD
jgi:hypothetical protein